MLLLSNIVFAVFQWLVPFEQLLARQTTTPVAEQLQLLSEPEAGSAANLQKEALPVSPAAAVDTMIDGKLCYTLGPFKQQQIVQEAVNQFKQNGVTIKTRSSQEKEYLGMMVYSESHATRDLARATAASLKEKGISDYIIVNEPGKQNILSLGVFSLKKNAERRQQRISELGYKVFSEPRYRNRTIYWLDYSQPENDSLENLVDDLKQRLGISRIARQC